MAREEKGIKVLLCQPPLETHSRGVFTVAGILRDAGMEVVYIGNSTPAQVIETAVQEDADVVGVSTLCGGELVLGNEMLRLAEEKGIKERTLFLMGGIFPPDDIPKLKQVGFGGVFPPASTGKEIISCINTGVSSKRKSRK